MSIRRIATGVAGAIALAALAGCAATSSPESSISKGQTVTVPMLEDTPLSGEGTAVDRGFDDLEVEYELDPAALDLFTGPQRPDDSLACASTNLEGLPDQVRVLTTRAEVGSSGATREVIDPRKTPVYCVLTHGQQVSLDEVWTEAESFQANDNAKYTVRVDVPLDAVEVRNA